MIQLNCIFTHNLSSASYMKNILQNLKHPAVRRDKLFFQRFLKGLARLPKKTASKKMFKAKCLLISRPQ